MPNPKGNTERLKPYRFTVGNPGRRPGIENKVQGTLKRMITDFLESRIENVREAFDNLTDKDKLTAFIKLSELVIPSRSQVQVSTDSTSDPYSKRLTDLNTEQLLKIEQIMLSNNIQTLTIDKTFGESV